MIQESERAKFLQEMIDIIDPAIDIDLGNSGDWVYGNYIEWHPLECLDDAIIDALCEYFNIDKKLSKKEICDLLREEGVPEETMYESDLDFPESAKYWKTDLDEYEYYLKHIIEYENYITKINEIMKLMDNSQNHLTKKSLILSALIFTESFITSKIVKRINDLLEQSDDLTKRLVEFNVKNDLRINGKRKEIFKIIFGKEMPNDEHLRKVRNFLAHDIGSANISGNVINHAEKNGKIIPANIQKIFGELRKMAEELNQIQ